MPRKPFFRQLDGWWYAQLNGPPRRQVKLVKGKENEATAWREFHRLLAKHDDAVPEVRTLTLPQLADLFLDFSVKHHRPTTFVMAKHYLQSLASQFPKLLARDLKPLLVNRWLDAHPNWKASRRHALIAVKRLYSWAENEGVLTANPVRIMKKPPAKARTRVLSDGERTNLLAAIKDEAFREFVIALQETGCRPGEIAAVTAADVDLKLGVWLLQEHKTAGMTGRPRTVYLTPTMLEISRKLMERHPEGPLFRTHREGKPYTRNAWRCRFRRLRDKLPELKGVVAYSFRHTFVTNALENGVGVAQVAELVGHTSTDMVMRHYQHLSQRVEHLRKEAERATRRA